MVLFFFCHIDNDNSGHHTHHNADIPHIKGRPDKAPEMKVQKIHHIAKMNTVYVVPKGTTKNGGKSQKLVFLVDMEFMNNGHQQDKGQNRQNQKQDQANNLIALGKQAKNPPLIFDIGDIEESGDDDFFLTQIELRMYDELGGLIQGHDGKRHNQKYKILQIFHKLVL